MKQKLLNVSEKYKETLECKQQSTQTNAKLNGENGIKIPKSLTSLPTKKSLHKDDYASFDFGQLLSFLLFNNLRRFMFFSIQINLLELLH